MAFWFFTALPANPDGEILPGGQKSYSDKVGGRSDNRTAATHEMVKALYVYLVRHAESKNNSRDLHDSRAATSMALPSPKEPSSPKEPRFSPKEGYLRKKDVEEENAELSITSDVLLPSPRPGREPDPGLTGRGKEQAKAVAELLRKIRDDPKTEPRLSDKDVNELRGLAERLTKGHESLAEMLKDLELEREELEKEKGQLNETISLFMKDLQKLNIGASRAHNTVEPMLEEGPLDFVGRFWETVKPRDSAYVTGEHIGEIRKPGEKTTGPTNPLAALKEAAIAHELPNHAAQVQEKVQERVHEVAGCKMVYRMVEKVKAIEVH
eukprot:s182_g40.t1